MVIEKKKEIIIPVWTLQLILSVLFTGFMIWGYAAAANGKLDRATNDIETLRREKVSKDVFDQVMIKLNSIDKKLDEHIADKR